MSTTTSFAIFCCTSGSPKMRARTVEYLAEDNDLMSLSCSVEAEEDRNFESRPGLRVDGKHLQSKQLPLPSAPWALDSLHPFILCAASPRLAVIRNFYFSLAPKLVVFLLAFCLTWKRI